MRAALLSAQGSPLELRDLPDPVAGPGQIRLHVSACGACRADLHLRDTEIPAPKLPVVLGHQIVGRTEDGRRLGVPWLGWTCGECRFCRGGRENLCPRARFTGRDIDSLGATWSGASTEPPPERLDAALIFASDGALVQAALRALERGGTVICAGIHMTDIPPLSYDDLWLERSIRSVANLTRADAEELLALAPTVSTRTSVTTYALEDCERALSDLRDGRFEGSAVLLT